MNKIGNHTAISETSTLLVLRHRNNSVGIVQSVNSFGILIDVKPDHKKVDTIMRIDSSEDSFMDFYADFYQQLKNPFEYSFFKVREYEAKETARGLQEYINGSSEDEKQDLKKFEVSIDTVDAIRNKKYADKESSVVESGFNKESTVSNYSSQCRFKIEDVPWKSLAEIDLDREKLESMGALESLLKGFKTPMLIPIPLSDGYSVSMVDVRLQLRLDDRGEVVVRIHRVLEKPDFNEKFMGHEFTKEDELNLLNSGNMGRVVGLVDPWTDEVVPSLISMDRLTNELIPLRMEFVRIPAVICGVTLNLEQVKILRDGKPLFIENMLSKKGTLFSATVQFNTDKQWIEFLFKKNLKGFDGRVVQTYFDREVPTVFRGKYLRKWQMDKLRAGETAYISGLVNKNGEKYQGYLSFDWRRGKIVFSFKNPKKR
ncbi:DUF3945 domain-containing protein [Chryseobacterium sp. CFBP8996]|uniref:DUF3945 domain-containing protein n=1 Tax=Chryseobacterium sp. CFBP8996 TaxID=3096529 RepID=UPI002A6A859E|nr:DUF3945 domain-containing protein [Chryseobacterium sp. CFBP8996]MDY0930751.1 DUF3945 domain-containing protein [Chryseobacterium sp. CFBP8996]